MPYGMLYFQTDSFSLIVTDACNESISESICWYFLDFIKHCGLKKKFSVSSVHLELNLGRVLLIMFNHINSHVLLSV